MLPANQQQIKRKVFVSYHHTGDQAYYDAFSKASCDMYDVITDNSLEREVDSNDVDYVRRRIRENYLSGSSWTIVLVGKDTWGRKYVDWEIGTTLEKEHGLIGVQLPTAPLAAERKVGVPGRLYDNIPTKYSVWTDWKKITAGAVACTQLIEQANARDKKLINDSCERRLKNG